MLQREGVGFARQPHDADFVATKLNALNNAARIDHGDERTLPRLAPLPHHEARRARVARYAIVGRLDARKALCCRCKRLYERATFDVVHEEPRPDEPFRTLPVERGDEIAAPFPRLFLLDVAKAVESAFDKGNLLRRLDLSVQRQRIAEVVVVVVVPLGMRLGGWVVRWLGG